MNAMREDHGRFTAARIAFQRKQFLHLELPNGRRIRYLSASLRRDLPMAIPLQLHVL
jgi:hypothetical protein